MRVVNYSHARNNLKSIIDNVCDNNKEVIVTTKNNKTVVILSMNEHNRTHAQVKREAEQALLEAERSDLMDIDEVFDTVLAKYED